MLTVSAESLLFGLFALGVGGWGVLVIRRWPAVAAVGYLVVLMLVPAWLVVPIGLRTPLPILQVVGLGIVVGMFGLDEIAPTTFDVVLLGFSALLVVMGGLGLVDTSTLTTILLSWVLSYLVARTLAVRGQTAVVYDAVAVIIAVVAVLAIVESVTSRNFFDEYLGHGSFWAQLQYRGGRVRVEGAFGHSISLGAVLGMSVPMVWASRWRPWFRVVTLALVGVAATLTFSRIGMLTTILALAASFVLLRKEMPARVRWMVLAVGGVVAAVLVPTVMTVFDDASTETTGTADYRVFLLSLLPKLALFGQATSPDVQYFLDATGSVSSIDNEWLVTGIRLGLLPLAVLLACAVAAVVAAVRRPNPGLLAAVVMLPGLTSVAFITQFPAFFWFAIGIGVSTLAGQGTGQDDETDRRGAARAGPAQVRVGSRAGERR